MLSTLRTYRFIAAFLAALLWLSGSAPLIQHACAMTTMEAMPETDDCNCDAAPAPASNETPAEIPCDTPPDAVTQRSTPAQQHLPSAAAPDMHEDCCLLMMARADMPEMVRSTEQLPHDLLAPALLLLAGAPLPDVASVHAFPSPDTDALFNPQTALHILHASFLN